MTRGAAEQDSAISALAQLETDDEDLQEVEAWRDEWHRVRRRRAPRKRPSNDTVAALCDEQHSREHNPLPGRPRPEGTSTYASSVELKGALSTPTTSTASRLSFRGGKASIGNASTASLSTISTPTDALVFGGQPPSAHHLQQQPAESSFKDLLSAAVSAATEDSGASTTSFASCSAVESETSTAEAAVDDHASLSHGPAEGFYMRPWSRNPWKPLMPRFFRVWEGIEVVVENTFISVETARGRYPARSSASAPGRVQRGKDEDSGRDSGDERDPDTISGAEGGSQKQACPSPRCREFPRPTTPRAKSGRDSRVVAEGPGGCSAELDDDVVQQRRQRHCGGDSVVASPRPRRRRSGACRQKKKSLMSNTAESILQSVAKTDFEATTLPERAEVLLPGAAADEAAGPTLPRVAEVGGEATISAGGGEAEDPKQSRRRTDCGGSPLAEDAHRLAVAADQINSEASTGAEDASAGLAPPDRSPSLRPPTLAEEGLTAVASLDDNVRTVGKHAAKNAKRKLVARLKAAAATVATEQQARDPPPAAKEVAVEEPVADSNSPWAVAVPHKATRIDGLAHVVSPGALRAVPRNAWPRARRRASSPAAPAFGQAGKLAGGVGLRVPRFVCADRGSGSSCLPAPPVVVEHCSSSTSKAGGARKTRSGPRSSGCLDVAVALSKAPPTAPSCASKR